MAVKDLSTYVNSKVGRFQEADRFFMKEDGYFQFYDVERTGLELRNQLAGGQTEILVAAVSTVFAITNYSVGLKNVWFSMTSTLVAGAYAMVSGPKAGEEVYLGIKQTSNISGTAVISFSGCSFVGLLKGSTLTTLTLQNSAGSAAKAHLVCFADGEWTAVEYSNNLICVEA